MKLKYLIPLSLTTITPIMVLSSCATGNSDRLVAIPTNYLDIDNNNFLIGFNEDVTETDLKDYGKLTIPARVKLIDADAFICAEWKAKHLTKVDYEPNCECGMIGTTAFANNDYLSEVILPPKLKRLGLGPFMACSSLSIVDISNVENEFQYSTNLFNYCVDTKTKGKFIVDKTRPWQKQIAEAIIQDDKSGCSEWIIEKK